MRMGATCKATRSRPDPLVIETRGSHWLFMRESISYRSTGKLDSREAQFKYTKRMFQSTSPASSTARFRIAVEQTLYAITSVAAAPGTSGFPQSSLHGDGHIVVGKLDAPAPPALATGRI